VSLTLRFGPIGSLACDRLGGLALQIAHAVSEEHACDYLPAERAALEYRVLVGLLPEELEGWLERGWRRFGAVLFRPACRACGECVSVRIPVADFHPSRSQRRARNRSAHLTMTMGPPRVDAERLALYARWHQGREQSRGWEAAPLDAQDYARQFGLEEQSTREVLYRDGDRLVGAGICDETDTALSAVYFFHDPAYARLSLGVNHVVRLTEWARQAGKAHVYLGYWVRGCASMRYKAGFVPHERLVGRPASEQPAIWSLVGR
jgi:arginyl-tRNA--protein-N-Asp/Glu arginylyltransferase